MAQIMEEMDTKDDKRKKRFSIWKKVPDLVYGRQLATYRKKNTKLQRGTDTMIISNTLLNQELYLAWI